jgi:taurine transport system ATP-binding protein
MNFSYNSQAVFSEFGLVTSRRIVGLSGPPGCGKTTLLKILAGFLKPATSASFEVPQGGLLILQEDALLPWLTGWENLELVGLKPRATVLGHPLYTTVEPFLGKRAHAMSFGQRRTVELFRALAIQPDFLCLDEPFNFLDEMTRSTYLGFLLHGNTSRAVVMSTHHVLELERMQAEVFRFSGELPVSSLEAAI